MDSSEILELENRLLHPTTEPISLPLYFLRSITRDFSNDQELGRGGYGVVYKGLLRWSNSSIAVKRIHDSHLVHDDQFQKEATFLMGIQHPNVIRLLGYCSESKGEMIKIPNGEVVIADKQTRILCFEYMYNEGLDKHLSDESSGLEWNMRYEIIKGICSGLNFLHECNIVHLDLKPQNILMDADMKPKIADFGLSRLLGEQKSYTITSNHAGTMGYMAPEYIFQGEISKKADIFSLGVIIIEILKGCREYPLYHQSTESDIQHFIEKVFSNWRNRFEEESRYTALELHTQQVIHCIKIALECVHPERNKRPNALDIINILDAAESSRCLQSREDSRVKRMKVGSQEGVPPDVLRENKLAALVRSIMKDYAPARMTEHIWNKEISGTVVDVVKSVVAPPSKPRHEPVLACAQRNEESLAAHHYQGARNASFWVAHKAQASLDNLLKDWAFNVNLGPSVEALERELISVKAILESTLGKVIHNSALEHSLMMLQDPVYNAEDVLDEMEYFCIQDMLHGTIDADYQHDNEPQKLIFDRVDASRRIEYIVEQLQLVRQEVYSTIRLLGSDWSTAPNIAQSRPITISESIEPKLYGRELIMKSIIDDITNGKHSSEVLTVIPIVGPGGIGKTTLAQHLYHSGEVQEHFNVRVWICVSLNFNAEKLTEEIQKYIPKVEGESINDTACELIRKRIKNKRLLLVLDDIWDCREDDWKRLLLPFNKSQVQGNIIIVTTRFLAQRQVMNQNYDHSIYLRGLESEEFKELFLQIVFGDDEQSRKDHAFLLETGFRIVDRLKGSPLAAKTVGRLLKTQLDLDHWTSVLESKEWEQSYGKNDIMHVLKLSFDYLPSQLQQCFSYCALFPQDYKFEREEIINFWIGLEVLHPSHGENRRVEDIGLRHLTELVNYGFLENKGGNDGIACYTIHDLLHELARKVSSLECLSIDSSQSQVSSLKVLPSIRHLSINIDDTNVKDRLTLKKYMEDLNTLDSRLTVEKLRTLMLFGKNHGCFVKVFGNLFREAKALRVIFLSEASYDVEDLLQNFYSLVHLRYLRIGSHYLYKSGFPNKISRFYHMMVLDAKHCSDTICLPRGINNLVKLRHFLVPNEATHSLIFEVGKLKSLQELRRLVVKQEGQGFELSQIGHLVQLRGSLCIDNLENVWVKEEADEAKLMQKSHLHELILNWNIDRFIYDSTLEEDVLERLKPSSNLLKLSVKGHRGAICPSWLGMNLSVKNLESLCLDGVAWKTFPAIGEFWLVNEPHRKIISGNLPDKRFENMRRLELCQLNMVKKWTVHAPCQLFPFLEVLIIHSCSQLVELSFKHFACCQQGKEAHVNLFPRLTVLKIDKCPRLLVFPPVPWIDAPCSINIKGTGSSCLRELVYGKDSNSEYSLKIDGKYTQGSSFWNTLAFHNLTGLKQLRLSYTYLSVSYKEMLSSLRTLQLDSVRIFYPFVHDESNVEYKFPVERLTISNWSSSGKELTQLLTYFPKLSYLKLSGVHKITKLCVIGQHATAATRPSSSANKAGKAQIEQHQQQDARAQGLLLLPPQLQELTTLFCSELSICSNPLDNNNKDGRTRTGLHGLSSLQRLVITFCPKLLSSYSSSFSPCFPFPSSLQFLRLLDTSMGMLAPLPLSNLSSLTSLSIINGMDLRGKGLLSPFTQGHLTRLEVIRTPKFFLVDSELSRVDHQELPSHSSKLQELKIDDVAGFTAMPIHRNLLFNSLTTLEINMDYKLERFTEEQVALLFVDSLKEIKFMSCHKMQSMPEWLHRLPNLKMLHIEWCEAIQMLPKDGLPSSLQELNIIRCPEIRSLPKDCLPDSLQKLLIRSCPAIRSLPEVDDLPSSLRELNVSESGNEELRRQCYKLINIIPIVKA